MSETYVLRRFEGGLAVVCKDCHEKHYYPENRSYLQTEIEEIQGNAIAYVKHGFPCFDCEKKIGSPLNIPFLGIADHHFDDSPYPVEDRPPEELTIPPIDFDQSTDEAIARWLLLQPKHYFGVPAWQVCALIDSIYWILYALDHPDESWDVEADKNRLKSFQHETLMFLWDNNPPIRTLNLSHQKRLPSIFKQVKEVLDDAASKGN